MPPRPALGYNARGGSARRDATPLRGGTPSRGTGIADHINAIGVKRPSFGNSGQRTLVYTNHFKTTIPEGKIHHYDVILPADKVLPAAMNFELVKKLQTELQPEVFTPRGVYDGRKSFFTAAKLSFGDAARFDVTLAKPLPTGAAPGRRGPTVYTIQFTHVAEINPEVLARFIQGTQSPDNAVLTAITALNVVVRMEPNLKFPFNVRSFFTPSETADIGSGIVLWRGYFQSVRPAVKSMLINIDISTAAMYKSGTLLNLCLEFFGKNQPAALSTKSGLPERERNRLQRFLTGLKVKYGTDSKLRTVKKLTVNGAADEYFVDSTGKKVSVADHFKILMNHPLRFPDMICIDTGKAVIPIEICQVPAGQILRKQLPSEKTSDVLKFATKRPQDRLNSIRSGLDVLSYGTSEYVRQFGMTVNPEVMKINARVLPPPTLKYGQKSKEQTIVPKNGSWNMIDKHVYVSCPPIKHWCLISFDAQRNFNQSTAAPVVEGLVNACKSVGIAINPQPVVIKMAVGQNSVASEMQSLGMECHARASAFPALIVVILPEGGNDIYSEVKHFGDVARGVVTQCMKRTKCMGGNSQYFSNVVLKLNVKMGGINTIPDPRSVSVISDPSNPTIVMGADVVHPAPGTEGRPSFSALVANVDSDNAKYIATMNVQTSRKEIIEDLEKMATHVLQSYMRYRDKVEKKAVLAPKRIIFYRDGVSEGQFQTVLDEELPLIKKACAALKINPKITMVIVGKRHHVRFFPTGPADKSGNCPAGLVVDSDVVNPVEFDFYLQSHAGLLGTSRPSHYNVLYDENHFTADGLQALSFALCHVYARSTRSVSIPAPVYYADIVCSRAKHHYDPEERLNLLYSDNPMTPEEQQATLAKFKEAFRPLSRTISTLMYFC